MKIIARGTAYDPASAPPALRFCSFISLVCQADGRWLIGFRTGSSKDSGDVWVHMSVWTFGHPAAAQLPNGDVVVAYYAGDDTRMGVPWVRIALS